MKHICDARFGFTLDNGLRRLIHDPLKILDPHVRTGMHAMDVGCGPGHFILALAQLVGASGKVLAVDLQEAMLEKVRRKAGAVGLDSVIALHRATGPTAGAGKDLDFILCFWMLHEVPDARRFLEDLHARLKPGGVLLLSEPILHVGRSKFQAEQGLALMAGFRLGEEVPLRLSRAVLLQKEGEVKRAETPSRKPSAKKKAGKKK